jgi:hypothetical protein
MAEVNINFLHAHYKIIGIAFIFQILLQSIINKPTFSGFYLMILRIMIIINLLYSNTFDISFSFII